MALRKAQVLTAEMAKVTLADPARTKVDVESTLQHHGELRPIAQMYTSNDGRQQMRLSLKGTIRCTIQGTMYHIPILLWLDQNHPMIAPLCFVDPTQGENMRVTPSINVLATGQIVNHACIDQWSPGGGLYILVTQLVSMFAHASPVHSVAAPAPTPQSQYGQPQSQYGQPQSQYGQPRPQYGQAQPHYGQQYPATANLSANPYPFGRGPGAAEAQHAGHVNGGSTGYNPQPFGAGVQGGGGGEGRDYHQPQHQAATPSWEPIAEPSRMISEPLSAQVMRDSAVGCAQDKLLRQLGSKHQLSTTEITKAQNTNTALVGRARKFAQTQTQLSKEIAETEQAVKWYEGSGATLQANVATMQQQAQQFEVDLAVVPTHPLFEQLIELEADKLALEETLYNTQKGYINTRRGGLAPTSNLIEMMIVIRRLANDKFDMMEKERRALKLVAQAPPPQQQSKRQRMPPQFGRPPPHQVQYGQQPYGAQPGGYGGHKRGAAGGY